MSRTVDAPPTLQIGEITTAAELAALRPEWSALWERCPGATPFGHPEWLGPWWRRFGEQPGWTLWALALRAEGRLVGLAPWFLHPAPDPALRQLSPLGIGITDYLDPLLEPGIARDGAARWFEHLAEHRDRWDVCDLEQLRAGSPLLDTAVPPELAAEARPQEVCPTVALPHDPDEFHAALPAWLRRNLRQGRSRLEKAGALAFETADAATLPEFLDAFFRLQEVRARGAGRSGIAEGEPAVRRFLCEAAAGLLARGLLQMHGIRSGGRLVAVFYGLADREQGYAYQSGFDPALGRCNPGTLVVGYAIEQAIRRGAREWNFLRGAEEYKYYWGAHDRQTFRLGIRHAGRE